MITDDPHQDASRAYMKLNSMARMSEIERTVKNSRFGPPPSKQRTIGNKTGKARIKKDRVQNTLEPQSSINKAHGRAHVKPIAKQMEHQTMRQQGERKQKVKF